MPTYDYLCTSCKNEFEVFQSMTEKPKRSCPECNGPVKRLIGSGAGIMFKGSGFYETDYKRSSSGESKAKAETKTESKDKPKKAKENNSSDKH